MTRRIHSQMQHIPKLQMPNFKIQTNLQSLHENSHLLLTFLVFIWWTKIQTSFFCKESVVVSSTSTPDEFFAFYTRHRPAFDSAIAIAVIGFHVATCGKYEKHDFLCFCCSLLYSRTGSFPSTWLIEIAKIAKMARMIAVFIVEWDKVRFRLTRKKLFGQNKKCLGCFLKCFEVDAKATRLWSFLQLQREFNWKTTVARNKKDT
jgi:hypothetical protein